MPMDDITVSSRVNFVYPFREVLVVGVFTVAVGTPCSAVDTFKL